MATSGLSEPSDSEWWGLIVDALVNDSSGPYYGSASVSINTQGLPGYVVSLYLSGDIDAETLSEYINYVDPNGNQMPSLLDQMGATEQYENDLAAIEWGNNKDFIVSQCTDGTCPNSDMQAWYDRWVRSGSPDTKDGMLTQAEYDQYTSIPQSEAEVRTILQNEGYSEEEINDLMSSIVDNEEFYGSTTLSNILKDLGYWEAADQWDVNPKVGSWCTAPDGTIGKYEEGGICVSQGVGSEGDPCGYNNQGTKDSTGQCIGGEDPGVQTVEEMIEQIATEEQVDQSVVEGVADIISTVKGALPTDLEEASDLIKQVLGSTILGSALEECESWTGNTTTDGGLGVPSWTKCVDVGIFGIPGLDLPLPPGMIDISITVYDIIQKGEDIGESFEDFINDPSGWLENVIDKAVDKVQEVWGDITSGLDPKSAGDLLDILNGWIGNILGGYILNQVKDATEVLDPFLYSKGCTEEGFQEPYEGYCEEAVNNNRLVQCADGSYVNTIDECPEGAFGYCADGVTQKTDAEGTNCPEYEPPYVDEGPTPEECTQQGRAHIPGNPSANPPTQSTCGDCLGGWSEVDNQCTEDDDPITNQGPTPEDCLAQKREFIAATDVADSSCGECLSSYEDINGECTERTPVECWDGSTVYDEANCPEDTRVECWDGSLVASLDQCPEQPPETIKCEDRDAQNFGEEGECVYGPIVEECNEDTATATKKVTQTIPYGTVVRPAGPQYQLIDGVCTEVITEYVQEEATEGTCQDDQADNTGQEGPCVYTCPKGTNRQGQQVSSLDECNDTKDPPEVYCDDPKSTNYDQLGECGPDCVEGWYKPTPDSPCTEVVVGPPPVVDVCEDGSLRDPETGCPEDYCPDGSLKGLNGECPEGPDVDPECNDCTCEEYALENPLECGGDPECNDCTCEEYANDPANFLECGGDPECVDCTCAEYALENPLECGPVENPCDDPSFAEENPVECGWVECPNGGFAPTIELCGGGGCPEGTVPCETLGGECTTPEECPGEEEEEVSLGGPGGSGGLFKEFTPTLSGDPELLARQEFPITDFLMGLFPKERDIV